MARNIQVVVSFKAPPWMRARLREIAEQQGWKMSQVARWIISTALGEDPKQAALDQVSWSLSASIQAKMPVIWTRVAQLIDEELAEPFRQAGEAGGEVTSPLPMLPKVGSRPAEIEDFDEGPPEEELEDETVSGEELAGLRHKGGKKKTRRGKRGRGKRKGTG